MAQLKTYQKTRIAPTPSGYLHVGNIASFVLTIGLARKYGASIFLRIDDIDHQRVRKEYINDIFDTLNYLGLPWDEGPRNTEDMLKNHSQTKRTGLYKEFLDTFVRSEKVFACHCSRKQLGVEDNKLVYPGTCIESKIPLDKHGVSWRLNTNDLEEVIKDSINTSPTTYRIPNDMKFVVVRKKDGSPSYQLSSVVDDILLGVDLIIRGKDLLDSTIIQHNIARQLGENDFCLATFIHHPLVTSSAGKKLSKSAGSTSINFLRRNGLTQRDIWKTIASSCGIDHAPTDWEDFYPHLEQKWIT